MSELCFDNSKPKSREDIYMEKMGKIKRYAETIYDVQILEMNDKNFLCGVKARCSMQKELSAEIVRLCKSCFPGGS